MMDISDGVVRGLGLMFGWPVRKSEEKADEVDDESR